MRIKVEHIIGIISGILGIITIVLSLHFPKFNIGEEKIPGPAFFPNLIAILLILIGIAEFFEARKSNNYLAFSLNNKKGLRNILVVVICMILYIALMRFLGFIIVTFLFIFIIMYFLNVGILRSLIYAFILLAILILIFEKLFRIPLPGGIFNLYI